VVERGCPTSFKKGVELSGKGNVPGNMSRRKCPDPVSTCQLVTNGRPAGSIAERHKMD